MAASALEDAIDRVLPQTQCAKCGYPACRPYARAVASGDADINRCPPGGDAGIRRLAALTGRPYRPLDPACGREQPRRVALIEEALCIGCTLCIDACPVDAIVGAQQQMHTVITGLCTGCELCLSPCPVDCIVMVPAIGADAVWDERRADAARERHERRQARLGRRRAERAARRARSGAGGNLASSQAKRAAAEAALGRARAKRAAPGGKR
jgi:Na+-translocating ferredoxin:NAD+ oxidoreductase subunit B